MSDTLVTNTPSVTTQEQDRFTSSRRQINLIWEITQAGIAIAVVLANLFGSLRGIESTLLSSAFFLVIGFYFGRTNHARPDGLAPAR